MVTIINNGRDRQMVYFNQHVILYMHDHHILFESETSN